MQAKEGTYVSKSKPMQMRNRSINFKHDPSNLFVAKFVSVLHHIGHRQVVPFQRQIRQEAILRYATEILHDVCMRVLLQKFAQFGLCKKDVPETIWSPRVFVRGVDSAFSHR